MYASSINYRRRKMKKKNTTTKYIIRTVIIIIALIIAYFLIKMIKYSDFMQALNQTGAPMPPEATKQPSDKYSAILDNFTFNDDTTGTKAIGQTQTITEDTPNTYCAVNYPVIGMDSIDSVLKAEADNIIAQFNTENAEYIADSPEARAYLNVDYQSYVTGDSIASFVYDIQYTSPDSKSPVQEVRTHNFLLATGNDITFDKILMGDYLEYLSYKTTEYVNANPEFYKKDSDEAEKYTKNYSASARNFKDFSVSMNGLTLYFMPGRIAPKKFGYVSFTIPSKDILPFMVFDPFKKVKLPVTEIAQPEEAVQPAAPTIDPSKPMVAFTFDDGPNKGSTERILNTLEKHGVHATFFLVGNRIDYNKDIVKRMHELGCDVASHSFDHAQLNDLKKKKIKQEYSRTNSILKNLIGDKAHFVRTPYGTHTDKILEATDYPVILWNVDTEDWKSRNKKKILKRVIGKVNDGDIILMHDIYDSTADAVETMVPKLIKQGYQIVSVSEMFEAKGVEPKNGTVYYNIR